jgi:hypothetical protein
MMALSFIWMLQNGQLEKGETIALSPFHACAFEGAKVRNELLFITISRRHNRQ